MSKELLAVTFPALVIAGAHVRAGPSTGAPSVEGIRHARLVALWSADGNARDSLGRHHGAAGGGLAYTADRHGSGASAFLFDGRNGFVSVPDDALDTDDAFTLCAWILKAYEGATSRRIVSKWQDTSRYGDYALQLSNSGQLCFVVARSAQKPVQDHVNAKSLIPRNRWAHVAATFDRGEMKLYINGKLDAAKTSDKVRHTDRGEYRHDEITIGASWDGKFVFQGAIDEVCIYDRALRAAEVLNRCCFGPCAPPYLGRIEAGDRILVDDGNVLVGTITDVAFTLTTLVGRPDIPTGRVAGFVRVGGEGPRVRLVLTDGQVIAGKLSGEHLRVKLPGGSTLKIPWRAIRRCGFRVTKARPAARRPSGPMVILTTGDRLAFSPDGLKLMLDTGDGKLDLPVAKTMGVEAIDPRARTHWVRLRNGSGASGTLLPEKLTLRLRLGPGLTVHRERVCRLVFPD